MNNFRLIPLEERIVLDAAVAAVIYVDVHASGSNNGSSWSNAYTDLQSALNHAASTAGADQIWIADGTYKPTQIYSPNGVTGGASGLNDGHLKTFNLPSDVTLYGGFKGNENSLSKRNPDKYITILSGDLLGNDLSNRNDPNYLASKADNAWHIVTAGDDVLKTGVTAKLDGLTLLNGFAAGPNSNVGAVVNYAHEAGAGIYMRFGSNITVNNVNFRDNVTGMSTLTRTTQIGGGGIFADGAGTILNVSDSSFKNNAAGLASSLVASNSLEGGAITLLRGVTATISGSEFIGNIARDRGGALDSVGNTLNITDSVFKDNKVLGGIRGATLLGYSVGGGLRIANTLGEISNSQFINNGGNNDALLGNIGGAMIIEGFPFTVRDSTFVNNYAFLGGAIFTNGVNAALTLDHNTYINNKADAGGAVFDEGNKLNITDSTFIGNKAKGMGGAVFTGHSLFDLLVPNSSALNLSTISNSLFLGNVSDGSQVYADKLENFVELYSQQLAGIATNYEYSPGGGAISNSGNAQLSVTDSTFLLNRTLNGDGGAILNGGASLVRLATNVMTGTGGVLTVNNSNFIGNIADDDGGAISSKLVSPQVTANLPIISISNSLFDLNFAKNGGAIYSRESNGTILGNTFNRYNEASSLGDKLYIENSTINGIHSSNSVLLIQNLIATNTFAQLDNDDIFAA